MYTPLSLVLLEAHTLLDSKAAPGKPVPYSEREYFLTLDTITWVITLRPDIGWLVRSYYGTVYNGPYPTLYTAVAALKGEDNVQTT